MPEGVQELEKGQHAENSDEEFLDDIEHQVKITLCNVAGNPLGEVVYAFYLEDPKNLKKPIGFEIIVSSDGTPEFLPSTNPNDLLLLLKSTLEKTKEK